MKKLEEIADDIEVLIDFATVHASHIVNKNVIKSLNKVEAWLASQRPDNEDMSKY